MIKVQETKESRRELCFRNNLKKNKVIHLTLLLFMILSAFLMTVASCVILQTFGSIENIFSIAKPPHFLQMHSGDLDEKEIQEFADSVEYVSQSEIVEMVNMDGANIWYEKKDSSSVSMSESMLDNGFVKQTKYFDYLLDLDNNIVKQKDGEIGVPITYMDMRNEVKTTIELRRIDICDMMLACLAAKELANDGGKKWDRLNEN